jgi:hypothetical protein
MGARRRRLPRVCFCDGGQQHRRTHDQGHIASVCRRRAYGREGQAERQLAVQLLLCASQPDVDSCVRLLPWCREVQPRMRRERFDRGELVLPHRRRTFPPSPVLRLRSPTSFLSTQNLFNNVTFMYPNANIWVIGHSLGGSLASLLGVTFGAPVVTFEPPGERMAAQRLHLPSPVRPPSGVISLTRAHFRGVPMQPSTQHITHVWHTADPIPMGTCTGSLSTCGVAGYAMESQCHLGNIIEYDTVTNLSWSVRLTNHQITTVIDRILSKPWPPAEEQGLEVPAMKRQDDCVVRMNLVDSMLLPDPRRRIASSGNMGTLPYELILAN